MKRVSTLLLAALGVALVAPVYAAPPDVRTPAPVIYLADNLDEKDGLGWCIDTVGRGLSDRLHAHSCKPRGGDVQFRLDVESGQIQSVAFAGLCASYTGTLPLGLVECADGPAQKFVYDAASMTLQIAGDPESCLVVGAASRSAGPFMSRDLVVAPCAETDQTLKAWVVKP